MLTGRYYFGDSNQSFPFAQLAGGLLPGFNTVTPTRVQLIALSYVKVVNSNQVNEARLGWNRFAEGFFPARPKLSIPIPSDWIPASAPTTAAFPPSV